jgi:hypothetical protein
MNTYCAGQVVKLVAGPFRNEAGEAVDPTDVTFKVRDATGNQTNYTEPARDGLGLYHQSHVIASTEAGGVTQTRVEGTGALIAAEQGAYNVKGDPFS